MTEFEAFLNAAQEPFQKELNEKDKIIQQQKQLLIKKDQEISKKNQEILNLKQLLN